MTERLARRLFLALLVVVVAFLVVRACRAGELGGCWAEGRWCAAPSAAATVAAYNITTRRFSGGLTPGIGFGVTYARDRWYAAGAALYLAVSIGGDQPNHAQLALLGSFAHYFRLGVATYLEEMARPQWLILMGVGASIGESP